MSFTSFNLAIGVTNQAQELLTVEGRHLVSAMMGPESAGAGNAEFYGQIFLASTESPTPIPISLLTSGYFGASVFIGWTGSIIMQPTYAVMARIWSQSDQVIRCTILTQDGP